MTLPTTDQHTPGPWRVERRVGDALQVNAEHRGPGSSYCVASINHWEGPADAANARLIAAAPDLLDVVRDLVQYGGAMEYDTWRGLGTPDETALVKVRLIEEQPRKAYSDPKGGPEFDAP